jgi:hypothetical protein
MCIPCAPCDVMGRGATVSHLVIDEMKSAFGQVGALNPAQARSAVIRHPGAMHF